MRRLLAGMIAAALLTGCASRGLAANEGQDDLDKATEAKLGANSLADLDEVIRLAESALKKGLDEGNTQFANGLLSSTLAQRGTVRAALTARTAATNPRFDELRKAALEDLERAVKLDAKQAQAWLFIAQLHRLPGGDAKRSNQALDEAVKAAGDDPETKAKILLTRATITDDEQQKLADLNEAIRLAPSDAVALRTRGLLKADQGKYEEALADLDKAIELDADHTPTYEAKAIVLTRLKRFDEAIRALEALQKLQPDAIAPIVQKARVFAAKSDLKAALAQINEAKQKNPENVALYVLQATLEEEPAQKLAAMDEAVKVAPKSTLALRTRGALKADMDKVDEALADFDKAIELQPKEESNYEAKALALAKAKRYDEALATADKLLEIDPDAATKRFRAAILSEVGKFDEAVAELKKLFEADSNDLSAGMALAMLFQTKKKNRQAIETYTAVLARAADYAPALRGRGDSYLNIAKHAEAIADYERALKLDAHDSGLLNNFAWVLCTSTSDKLRDGKRAIKMATEACELTDYKAPHILSTLGAAYAETGDFDTAIKWVEKGLEMAKEKDKDSLAKELENYKQKKPVREELNEVEEK